MASWIKRSLMLASVGLCALGTAAGPESAAKGKRRSTDRQGVRLPEGALFRLADRGGILALAFSPDGKTLASCADGDVSLWETASGRLRFRLSGGEEFLTRLAYSPDGKLLAVAAEKSVRLYDPDRGRTVRVLQGHTRWVSGICFAARGKVLLSGSLDGTIRLWKVQSGKAIGKLKGPKHAINVLAVSPDGKTLAAATGSPDDETWLHLWDIPGRKFLRTVQGCGGEALALSPDGKTLATGGGTAGLWGLMLAEARTGKTRWLRMGPRDGEDWDDSSRLLSVAFSPDGKTLASAHTKEVRLWDVATGKELLHLHGHSKQVKCVAFSPDGKSLASGGSDGTVLLWDVARLLRKGQRPVVVLTPQQLQGAWDRLGGTEYGSDPRASNLLIAGTDQTVPWLREKLQPAREAAAGSAADAKRSLEAVEVLAAIGTPKARRLLAKLAAGAPRAELTRKAKTALAKMAEDPSVP